MTSWGSSSPNKWHFGSHDGHVYAVNTATGDQVWKVEVGEGFNSSPAVAGGLVYFVDLQGSLIGVDPASGDEKWRVHPSGSRAESGRNPAG